MMSRTRRRQLNRAGRAVLLCLWAAFCLLPILWFLTVAFRARTEIGVSPPVYWPHFTLKPWHELWNAWPVGDYLRNTGIAVIGSVLLDLVLGIPAAYALSRFRFRLRDDLGFYILSTRMIVPAAVAIPIFALFKNMSLLDTPWALMLIFAAINLSIVTWIIRAYMMEIPVEIEHAAMTDGAGRMTILFQLMVPLAMPGIVTAATIAMIFGVNEFLFTLLISYTPSAQTMSVGLAMFTGGSSGIIFNLIALMSFILFVPLCIIVFMIQGHLSRGLSMGAVKG
ncbi:MAG TPA: carbohydrate ABC transporter permease [Gammaproteobacteria bacterium]|nr:carbohydrate ABC transporter permease [Gammaproteobacteria bacterium]